ncbi:MAG: hypothetical protein EAZ92_09470 [Candidatus Kapaibacterium sp.]|nr:MAG: hypothetical protein EAZ92_09470 [Candidatus Kapabacteria bacterium]
MHLNKHTHPLLVLMFYFACSGLCFARIQDSTTSKIIESSIIDSFLLKYKASEDTLAILQKDFDSNTRTYVVLPYLINKHCVLSIYTQFLTNAQGECFLGYLPKDEQHHRLLLHNLTASCSQKQATVTEIDSGLQWRIKAAPNSRVRVHYLIFLDSLTANNQDYYKPFPALFDKTYFILKGISLFLAPKEVGSYLEKQTMFELHWLKNPNIPQWKYANRFGNTKDIQKFHTSYDVFLNTLYCGGNADTSTKHPEFKLSNEAVDTTSGISLFTLGVFTDERHSIFIKELQRIIQAERKLWKDTTPFHYLSCLAGAGFEREQDVIAFAVHDSFFGILSDRITSINGAVKYLLSHEIMHRWIGPPQIPSESASGFGFCAIEGFTEYFARLVLLQSHSISEQEYVQEYNKAIALYHASAQKNAVADSVNTNFWKDLTIMRIPYYRGDILAHNWNAEITRHTKGKYTFADAFRSIRSTQKRITDISFAKSLKPYIGRDVMPDILRIMKKGAMAQPDKNALPFASLEWLTIPSPNDSTITVKAPQYVLRSSLLRH